MEIKFRASKYVFFYNNQHWKNTKHFLLHGKFDLFSSDIFSQWWQQPIAYIMLCRTWNNYSFYYRSTEGATSEFEVNMTIRWTLFSASYNFGIIVLSSWRLYLQSEITGSKQSKNSHFGPHRPLRVTVLYSGGKKPNIDSLIFLINCFIYFKSWV